MLDRHNVYTFDIAELSSQNRLPSASMSESPSLANVQNKQNRDQQYHAVRCQSNRNSNSNDSGSFKAEGNGKLCITQALYRVVIFSN